LRADRRLTQKRQAQRRRKGRRAAAAAVARGGVGDAGWKTGTSRETAPVHHRWLDAYRAISAVVRSRPGAADVPFAPSVATVCHRSFKWRRRDDAAMEAAAAALERLRRGAPVQAWVDAAIALVQRPRREI
jgi:hypothetical protein